MRSRTWILLVFVFTAGRVSGQICDTLQSPQFSFGPEAVHSLNYRAFPDLLNKIPGMRLRQTGAPGQWTDLRFHGIETGGAALFFDGMLLTDPWTGEADLNMVPVDQIESVGLFTGLNPFGSAPHGAALVIRPKQAGSGIPETAVTYRFGSEKFSNIGVTFGQQFTKRFSMLSGVMLTGHGEEVITQTQKGQNIYSRLNMTFDNIGFHYSVMNNQSDINLPFPMFIPGDSLHLIINLPHRKTNRIDQLLSADLRVNRFISEVYFQYASVKHEFRDYDSAPKYAFPAFLFRTGLKAAIVSPVLLTMNVESRWRQLKEPSERKVKDRTLQGALNADYTAGGRLKVLAGLSALLDSENRLQTALNSRLAIRPISGISVTAGYYEGIREISLAERYSMPLQLMPPRSIGQFHAFTYPYQYRENSGLRPEHSRTVSTGLTWQGPVGLRMGISGFITAVHNTIVPRIAGDSLHYANSGKHNYKGADFELAWGPVWGFSLESWLAYSRSLDENGDQMLERPTLQGWGGLSWHSSFFEDDLGVLITLSGRFCSDSWGVTGWLTEDPGLRYLNAFFMLNGKICLTIMKHANVFFAMDNITGIQAELLAGHTFPVQAYRAGITWTVFD